MKKLKKLFAAMVAMVMAFAMGVTVYAADITITNGAAGSEYAAYKLLNATDGGEGKFAYTLNDKYAAALKEVTGKTEDKDVINYISGLDADGIRAFADAVFAKIKTLEPEAKTSDDKFSGVDQGYYLIAETKTGDEGDTYSLVMLDTAGNDSVTVTTKEDRPELEKKVKEKNDSTGAESDWQDAADYDIGDNVPFQLTGTVDAKYDKKQYPGIITAGREGETPYYTNSSHLPVGYTSDIFEALDIQDELQTLYTSGTVFHAFLGEKLPDWKAAATLVRKIAQNYKLPYYTISPTYSICKEHGYIAGEHFTCPHCGKEAEVYSRITGYYRPVQNWNDGKTQEYKDRKLYEINPSKLSEVKTNIVTISKDEVKVEPTDNIRYLFTTKTCPNCAAAKEILGEENYVLIDAEENQELVEKYGVMQAPTLVVVENNRAKKYVNASNIKKYVETK